MNVDRNLASCVRSGLERRVHLNCDAVVTESDGCTVDVTLVDVSQHGFRLRSVAELELGSMVTLQMPEARPIRCEIRWACGHEAGGVFVDPIGI